MNTNLSNLKYLKYKNKYIDLKKKMLGGVNGVKTLYITIGVPGSGKTTRCERTAQMHHGVRFEADDYPGLYEPEFNPKKLGEAHTWCKKNVLESMEAGIEDIYQSNTNLNPRDMLDYLDMASKYGYIVKIITPPDGNLLHYSTTIPYDAQISHVKMVRSGEIEGQKQIPIAQMNTMIVTFEKNIGIIRKIKMELTDIDMENVPSAWIDKINENFIPWKPSPFVKK